MIINSVIIASSNIRVTAFGNSKAPVAGVAIAVPGFPLDEQRVLCFSEDKADPTRSRIVLCTNSLKRRGNAAQRFIRDEELVDMPGIPARIARELVTWATHASLKLLLCQFVNANLMTTIDTSWLAQMTMRDLLKQNMLRNILDYRPGDLITVPGFAPDGMCFVLDMYADRCQVLRFYGQGNAYDENNVPIIGLLRLEVLDEHQMHAFLRYEGTPDDTVLAQRVIDCIRNTLALIPGFYERVARPGFYQKESRDLIRWRWQYTDKQILDDVQEWVMCMFGPGNEAYYTAIDPYHCQEDREALGERYKVLKSRS